MLIKGGQSPMVSADDLRARLLGAPVIVLDTSKEMLRQNLERVTEAGQEHAVASRECGDITYLSRFEDDSFDAVVCYGGPLGYVTERADEALAELLGIARPGDRGEEEPARTIAEGPAPRLDHAPFVAREVVSRRLVGYLSLGDT